MFQRRGVLPTWRPRAAHGSQPVLGDGADDQPLLRVAQELLGPWNVAAVADLHVDAGGVLHPHLEADRTVVSAAAPPSRVDPDLGPGELRPQRRDDRSLDDRK